MRRLLMTSYTRTGNALGSRVRHPHSHLGPALVTRAAVSLSGALAKAGTVQSVTCREILEEFQGKLESKFSYSSQRARAAADEVRGVSRLVTITSRLKVVAADPDDDKVVECAVGGGATHIVTGDRRHLLPLGSYRRTRLMATAMAICWRAVFACPR